MLDPDPGALRARGRQSHDQRPEGPRGGLLEPSLRRREFRLRRRLGALPEVVDPPDPVARARYPEFRRSDLVGSVLTWSTSLTRRRRAAPGQPRGPHSRAQDPKQESQLPMAARGGVLKGNDPPPTVGLSED